MPIQKTEGKYFQLKNSQEIKKSGESAHAGFSR